MRPYHLVLQSERRQLRGTTKSESTKCSRICFDSATHLEVALHGRRGRLRHEWVGVAPQQVRRERQGQPGRARRGQRHRRHLHRVALLRGRQHRRQPLDRLLVGGRQSGRRRCRLRRCRRRRLDVAAAASARRRPALQQAGQRADRLLKRKRGILAKMTT